MNWKRSGTSKKHQNMDELQRRDGLSNGITAQVTGGIRGIGYAIVEELAGFGAAVYTCSRNEKELAVEQCNNGEQAVQICDLLSRAQREELMKGVSSIFHGKLNILALPFNNSLNALGEQCCINSTQMCSQTPTEDYSSIVRTNLSPPTTCSNLQIPSSKHQKQEACLHLFPLLHSKSKYYSSLFPHSNQESYNFSITSGAINQRTRNLACEWAKDHIRVNTVAPGSVKTTITKTCTMDIEPSIINALKQMADWVPLCSIAEPNEISPLAAFLCLPAASYITGQVICVDGAYTAGGLQVNHRVPPEVIIGIIYLLDAEMGLF
ncbi:unnamed protein product [Thlaspi arvense]|uniref:Tropinone reductase-like protein n=1 Tax=Thlaspi arvense TaxID=13288 RepID=A0AAU9RVP2_THLAR|nr:unnamed protein product [Thlaspi arvense]